MGFKKFWARKLQLYEKRNNAGKKFITTFENNPLLEQILVVRRLGRATRREARSSEVEPMLPEDLAEPKGEPCECGALEFMYCILN